MEILFRLFKEDRAQGMAEYAMILVFVAIVAMVGYELFGTALNAKVSDIANQL